MEKRGVLVIKDYENKERFFYFEELSLKIYSDGRVEKGILIKGRQYIINYANIPIDFLEDVARLEDFSSYIGRLLMEKRKQLSQDIKERIEWVDEKRKKISFL